MQIPAVSVVVPVYNVEKYIIRCLDSLIAQTLQNIEIIVVNDGSSDASLSIIDKYKHKHNNIKIINKENGGLSSARNAGIELASGMYIGFVDADDWVDSNMYENLYNSALKHQADMVLSGGFCKVFGNGDESVISSKLTKEVYSGVELIEELLLPMIGSKSKEKDDISIEMGVTLNLYRTEILNNLSLRFLSERIYISEDILFNIHFLKNSSRVSSDKSIYYYYWQSQGSLTRIYKKNRFALECELYTYMNNLLLDLGLLDMGIARLQRMFIGRARTCIISEVIANSKSNSLQKTRNIGEITNCPLLKEVVKQYPINHLPVKTRLTTYLIKYQLNFVLLAVIYMFKRI